MLTCIDTQTHTHTGLMACFQVKFLLCVLPPVVQKKEPLWIKGRCFLQAGCPNCQHQGT